jgi:ribosome biogenesis GTPase / thiamine phosphate phosphatase
VVTPLAAAGSPGGVAVGAGTGRLAIPAPRREQTSGMPVHPHSAEALAPYGWDDRVGALFNAAPEGTVPGRVTTAARARVFVQTAAGLVQATANPAGWTGLQEATPTTGDWVALHLPESGELATIAGVAPRTSQISRLDALGRDEQVLAANVDTVLIVHGLDRPLRPGRLERSLVLAWESGAVPAIVATKSDLVDDPGAVLAQIEASAGVTPVHLASAETGEGLSELRHYLEGNRTMVLLGESGAGKSSLVNALVGEEVQETADVREGDAKGRHTTVTRDLLLVPGGGVLIDTPGLRSLGLWDSVEGMALAFADIEELAEGCKFRDCAHESEPGCAVKAASDSGDLDPHRLDRYRSMQDEAAELDARRDAAARRESDRRTPIAQRAFRRAPKRKG